MENPAVEEMDAKNRRLGTEEPSEDNAVLRERTLQMLRAARSEEAQQADALGATLGEIDALIELEMLDEPIGPGERSE